MQGKFIHADKAEVESFDWGRFRWISRPATTGAHNLIVCHVEVFPGKGHDFHKHPSQEEVIHVIAGTMEQWLDTRKMLLGPGDSVFIPPETVHASFNTGKTPLLVLAILGPSSGPQGYELIDVSREEPWNTLRK